MSTALVSAGPARFRPESWTPDKLNSIQDRLLRLRGPSFYDGSHTPCHDNMRPNPQPISVWEIHPVYSLDVCKQKGKTCQDWVSLDEWNGIEGAERRRPVSTLLKQKTSPTFRIHKLPQTITLHRRNLGCEGRGGARPRALKELVQSAPADEVELPIQKHRQLAIVAEAPVGATALIHVLLGLAQDLSI